MTKADLAAFRFAGRGRWVHDDKKLLIDLDDDYGRTFRAYTSAYASQDTLMRNKAGNVMRFRSAEAAARYLLKWKVTP
jgi:hypothetical protein